MSANATRTQQDTVDQSPAFTILIEGETVHLHLLLGVLGLSLLVVWVFCVLFIPGFLFFENALVLDQKTLFLVFLFILTAGFAFFSFFADLFHSIKSLYVFPVLGVLISGIAQLVPDPILRAVLLALAVTILSVMWGGSFLCWLFHYELVIGITTAVLLSGLLIILTLAFNTTSVIWIVSFFPLLTSFSFILLIRSEYIKRYHFVPSKEAKQRRSIPVAPSIVVGIVGLTMSLGFFSLLVPVQEGFENPVAIFALVLILIAVILYCDIFWLKNLTEQVTLVVFVPLAITGILPMLMLDVVGKYFCGIVLVSVAIFYGLLIITSVTEVARFNQHSTIRAFGFCGLHYFVGTLLGWGICYIGELFSSNSVKQWSLLFIVWLLVIVGFLVFKPHPDHTVNWDIALSESTVKSSIRNAGWKDRVEQIAKEHSLSSRQTEILFLLAKGRNATYLQKEFYIAKGTAKSHINNIYRKLEVHSQQELMDMFDKK